MTLDGDLWFKKFLISSRRFRFLTSTSIKYSWHPSLKDALLDYGTIVKGKGKASSLDIAPLTILNSGTLQPRKWQLTGNDCGTAAHTVAAQSLR